MLRGSREFDAFLQRWPLRVAASVYENDPARLAVFKGLKPNEVDPWVWFLSGYGFPIPDDRIRSSAPLSTHEHSHKSSIHIEDPQVDMARAAHVVAE